MPRDRANRPPGGFQLRHRTLGVFQGTALEMAFWHPSSQMPEYGLCRFSTTEEAHRYLTYLTSPHCADPMAPGDLSVEAFDHALHESLIYENPLESEWESGR